MHRVCLISLLYFIVESAYGLEVTTYKGICDASAAEAIDAERFVVADDEQSELFIYKRGTEAAVASIPLSNFLGATKELDLEGAAMIGRRIYWISSHGRNKDAKIRRDRYQLFATDVVPGVAPPLKLVGAPYHTLLDNLVGDERLQKLGIVEAASRAPEADGGLNIEGLAATSDARLLIGFRNPIIAGKALIVPLENPDDLIRGSSAKLGVPILLDLGGRGIRSIERLGGTYLVVAGPPSNSGTFALYKWSGAATDDPVRLTQIDINGLSIEALFEIPESHSIQLLSDDGEVETNGIACKQQPANQRGFRSVTMVRP